MANSTAADARSESSGGRSGNSRSKYRIVSRGSDVDESLFGHKTSRSGRKSPNNPERKPLVGQVPTNATIISEKDLAAIRRRAVIKSHADLEADRDKREKDMEERQKAARGRKQRMLEMEEQAKLKAKKTDIEVEQTAHDQMVRELATEKLDQNNDLVKMLNSLGARAAAFTIRDEQLKEKSRREKSEKLYETRMDMIMELDRLKELSRRDDEEKAKVRKRVEDRKVIVEQMEARQRAKLLGLEAREQARFLFILLSRALCENKSMLAVIAKYADDDKAAAARKVEEVRKARAEVMAANEAAIEMRRAATLREKEEVEAILAYQAQKDAEMREREVAEAEKQQKMKERQQMLLEGQERDMDKQAELDELRARRAAEEKVCWP
ncbi:unnamed protein product [Discosporangium mesarthrocarpum]